MIITKSKSKLSYNDKKFLLKVLEDINILLQNYNNKKNFLKSLQKKSK